MTFRGTNKSRREMKSIYSLVVEKDYVLCGPDLNTVVVCGAGKA